MLRALYYIARRLCLSGLVLLGAALITFILIHSISDNPLTVLLGKAATMYPAIAEEYINRFHLNEPMYVQFGYYITGLLQGHLGFSWCRGEPVARVIAQTLPNTLQLVFFAVLFTVVLGIPLGILSCRFYNKSVDHSIKSFYLAGLSSPPFFLALVLILIFSYFLRLLPTGGVISHSIPRPQTITGFIILDSLLERNWAAFVDSLRHVVMPSMALALCNFGYVTRALRSSLHRVMQTNYIRTARAKGLDENTVFLKHALKNALMPVVTLIALIACWLLGLTVFVETIFAYPGMGQYLSEALGRLDYAAVLGVCLVYGILVVIANLAADMMYILLDPTLEM